MMMPISNSEREYESYNKFKNKFFYDTRNNNQTKLSNIKTCSLKQHDKLKLLNELKSQIESTILLIENM